MTLSTEPGGLKRKSQRHSNIRLCIFSLFCFYSIPLRDQCLPLDHFFVNCHPCIECKSTSCRLASFLRLKLTLLYYISTEKSMAFVTQRTLKDIPVHHNFTHNFLYFIPDTHELVTKVSESEHMKINYTLSYNTVKTHLS